MKDCFSGGGKQRLPRHHYESCRPVRGDRQPISRTLRLRFSRRGRGWPRSLLSARTVAIALALLLVVIQSLSLPQGAIAQIEEPLETSPVVLDGQQLFSLTTNDTVSAQERADDINIRLETWIDAGIAPDLFIDPAQPNTIKIDQASLDALAIGEGDEEEASPRVELLTVTKTDVRAAGQNMTPQAQAQEWREILEEAMSRALDERSPDFVRQAILTTLAVLALAAFLFWWIRRLKNRVLPHPLQELQHVLSSSPSSAHESPPSLVSILISLGLGVLQIALWVAVGLYVINLFPQTRDRSYEVFRAFMDSLFSPIFPLGGETYSITDLMILIAVFFGVILGSTVVANVLRSRILRMAGLSSGSQEAIAAITRYVLIAIGTIVMLQVWGLDLSSLTILASALGVGIGFGLQNIAKDFGSGLVLLFERPVQVGDFIEVDEFMGTVDRIGARSTSIKTLDQVSIIVPNSYFLENQVINWSHENPLSRIALPVGVSYSSDPEQVRTILLQAAEEHSGIVRLPRPQVFFKGFGNSSLDFTLMFWIVEPNRQPIIKSDLYFKIFALFRQEHIEIPFPQRDLHIRSGHLPVELEPPYAPSSATSGTAKGNGNMGDSGA